MQGHTPQSTFSKSQHEDAIGLSHGLIPRAAGARTQTKIFSLYARLLTRRPAPRTPADCPYNQVPTTAQTKWNTHAVQHLPDLSVSMLTCKFLKYMNTGTPPISLNLSGQLSRPRRPFSSPSKQHQNHNTHAYKSIPIWPLTCRHCPKYHLANTPPFLWGGTEPTTTQINSTSSRHRQPSSKQGNKTTPSKTK